jgi:hypothetical protein
VAGSDLPSTLTTEQPTLGEILRGVHRLEAKVDKVTDDHETRLRKVERWVYAVPPTLVLAAGSILAASVHRG